jgi:Holliday junction DNA helicase RuvA
VITFVRGHVAAIRPTEAVVDVGGIGLALHCTPATTSTLRLGDQVQLAASLVVREDSLSLYGFADDDERNVFELLQSASGVGPRLAQAMLSIHSPDELRRAVAMEDIAALCKVPGIGRKGAQRIVIELKDKLGAMTTTPVQPSVRTRNSGSVNGSSKWRSQVHEALLGLGWSAREADRAVDVVATTADPDAEADTAAMLKAALRTLAT